MDISRKKDKWVTAALAFVGGAFGVHRFYLNQKARAVASLIFCWTSIPFIIGFFDTLYFLLMDQEKFDRLYNPGFYRKIVQEEKEFYSEQEYPRKRKHSTKNAENLPRRLESLKKSIEKRLKKSDNYTKDVIKEIAPAMDKYIVQITDLLEKDKDLERILVQNSPEMIIERISEMEQQKAATQSIPLKKEYTAAIERHKKQQQSMLYFKDQREIIRLRLQDAEMSFKQIEYDLMKIETLNSNERRTEFRKILEDRTEDLGSYLEALKSTYED